MKYISLVLLLLLATAVGFAQRAPRDEARAFARCRIMTNDSTVIEADQIVATRDSLEYYIKGSPTPFVMDSREVRYVEEYKGRQGGTGSLFGSLLGAGIGVAIALNTKETTRVGMFEVTEVQTWPVYACTLVGGLLGFAIGNASESWDVVYTGKGGFAGTPDGTMKPRLPGYSLTYRWAL